MADNKKYYYMRLKEGFFDDDAIKLLEAMPDGFIYSNILLKMYLMSLKQNGKLMFNGLIPYSPSMIATLTRQQIGTVEKALDIFQNMGLIEILDNGTIYMLNIQQLIGKSSTEADRQRAYDRQIAEEKRNLVRNLEENRKIPLPEIEIEKEIDIEIEKEKETDTEKKKKETTLSLFNRLLPDYSISEYLANKLSEWMTYKMERKEPYKEQGMKSFLRQMEKNSQKYGDQALYELIDECMANGWKGIILDKLKEKQVSNTADRIATRVSDVDDW